MMTCAEFDLLLCDFVDGTLDADTSLRVRAHLAECPACAELAADCAGAVALIQRAAQIEPPAAAVTRILQQIPSRQPMPERARGFFSGLFGRWVAPILQPRMVMGMAMTILSFAMLGQFAGIEARQIRPADLNPSRVWEAAEDRMHRVWVGVVKYYDNLRLVYEIQLGFREMTEEGTPAADGASAAAPPSPQGEKR